MGIAKTNGQLQLLQDVIRQERLVLSGLRMAELGNQYFRDDVLGTEVSAKLVFEAMGVEHTSFDLNGKDGAAQWDLSIPIPKTMHGHSDIVTNFGTSEHVEQSQFTCWRNIHDLCCLRGFMIHAIPEVGSWPRHGKWHYDKEGLIALGHFCDYDICRCERHESVHGDGRNQHSLLFVFRKRKRHFMCEHEFNEIMFPPGEPHY